MVHPSQLPPCPVCGKGFIVNDGHRAYCSDACKMRAYRRRKLGLPINHLGHGAGSYDLLFARTSRGPLG